MHFTFTSSKTTSGVSYTSPKNAKKRFGSFSFTNKSNNDENKSNNIESSTNRPSQASKSPVKLSKPLVPLPSSNYQGNRKIQNSNIFSLQEVVKNSTPAHSLRSKSSQPNSTNNNQQSLKLSQITQKNISNHKQNRVPASLILSSPSKFERPFSGMNIFILGKLSWSSNEADAIIKKYGGSESTTFTDSVKDFDSLLTIKVTHIIWSGTEKHLEERQLAILRAASARNCCFLTEEDVVNCVHLSSEKSIDESPAKLLTFLEKKEHHRKEKPAVKAKNDFDKLLILAEQHEQQFNSSGLLFI